MLILYTESTNLILTIICLLRIYVKYHLEIIYYLIRKRLIGKTFRKYLCHIFLSKFRVHLEALYVLIIQLYANWPLRDYFLCLSFIPTGFIPKTRKERHVCVKAKYRPRENISWRLIQYASKVEDYIISYTKNCIRHNAIHIFNQKQYN